MKQITTHIDAIIYTCMHNPHRSWQLKMCPLISVYSGEAGSKRPMSQRRARYLAMGELCRDQLVASLTATMSLTS